LIKDRDALLAFYTPSANEGKRVYQRRWLDQVDFKTSTPAGF
jgi:hypothetical protein